MPEIRCAFPALALLFASSLPLPAGAKEPKAAEEVVACVERSVPEPDSVRSAIITHTSRTGDKSMTGVMMYGRRGEGGRRELLMRFVDPEELRGSAVLMLEREGENEVYFASSALGKVQRITRLNQASKLLGTDFSYEDLQFLEGFTPGPWKLKQDDELFGRPVYVVETKPEGSAYQSIVSRVDKQSCLPLNVRFAERPNYVTKELTIDGDSIRKVGTAYVPHSVLMRNRTDRSSTHIFLNRAGHTDIADAVFDPDRLLEDLTASDSASLP